MKTVLAAMLLLLFGTPALAQQPPQSAATNPEFVFRLTEPDRKSTRLNSSHLVISYAVFCLKKKKHARLKVGTGFLRDRAAPPPTLPPAGADPNRVSRPITAAAVLQQMQLHRAHRLPRLEPA